MVLNAKLFYTLDDSYVERLNVRRYFLFF